MLKLFFLSVLWRASVSDHEFYALIDIGASENIIRNMILRADPGNSDEFSIILARFINKIGMDSMLNPHPTSFNEIQFFAFYFYGYIAYIKNDKKSIKNNLRKFQLNPGKSLTLIVRGFNNSKEKNLLESIVRSAHKFQNAS